MKSLCENMLVPNRENWLDLLRAADLLQAHTLQRNVVAFLRDNFHALHLDVSAMSYTDEELAARALAEADAEADDFDDDGNPIYHVDDTDKDAANQQKSKTSTKKRKKRKIPEAAPVIRELQEEFPQLLESLLFSRTVTFPLPPSQLLLQRLMTSQKVTAEARQTPFPFWAVGVGIVCVLLYSQFSNLVSLGYLVPGINIGVTVIFVIYGAYYLYRELISKRL